MIGQALFWMVTLFVVQSMGAHVMRLLRCDYCGEIASHTPECPCNLERDT